MSRRKSTYNLGKSYRDVQAEFVRKIGERAYTAQQVSLLLVELGYPRSPETVRKYANREKFFVTAQELEITDTVATHWIPMSRVKRVIVEYLAIPVESKDVEDKLYELEDGVSLDDSNKLTSSLSGALLTHSEASLYLHLCRKKRLKSQA